MVSGAVEQWKCAMLNRISHLMQRHVKVLDSSSYSR